MTQSGQSYLVRMGPPAKGDMIHVSTCRYAQKPNALRWTWADEHDWDPTQTPWLKCCKTCHPEEWMARRILVAEGVFV